MRCKEQGARRRDKLGGRKELYPEGRSWEKVRSRDIRRYGEEREGGEQAKGLVRGLVEERALEKSLEKVPEPRDGSEERSVERLGSRAREERMVW
jgi:hypothetical protein